MWWLRGWSRGGEPCALHERRLTGQERPGSRDWRQVAQARRGGGQSERQRQSDRERQQRCRQSKMAAVPERGRGSARVQVARTTRRPAVCAQQLSCLTVGRGTGSCAIDGGLRFASKVSWAVPRIYQCRAAQPGQVRCTPRGPLHLLYPAPATTSRRLVDGAHKALFLPSPGLHWHCARACVFQCCRDGQGAMLQVPGSMHEQQPSSRLAATSATAPHWLPCTCKHCIPIPQ